MHLARVGNLNNPKEVLFPSLSKTCSYISGAKLASFLLHGVSWANIGTNVKIRMLIAATLAGVLAVSAFASPIDVDVPVADEAPLFTDASCDGSHCFDDTASQPSDFAAIFWAPADEMQPPLDGGSIYYASSSLPDMRAPLYFAPSTLPGWRAPMGDIKDVPEPGTLLLLGSALLLLSWGQIAQRR